MTRKCTFFFLAIFLNVSLLAADTAPKESHSYLALPAEQTLAVGKALIDPGFKIKRVSAILLIHEWWGLNDHIRDLADEFAKEGYVAFAVDLYEGKETADPTEAHELMRGLPEDRAAKTLKDAVAYLKSHSAVDPNHIAVIGWCMGGGYALQLALDEISIKAAVMYYGRLVTDETKLAKLKAPLLGIFGAQDRGISRESVEEFKADLERLGKPAEIYIYEEAGHAFANPSNPGYREADAQDAWQKTKVFLKQHLVS